LFDECQRGGYTCRYLVRQGATTWFVHYLMNVKGVDTLAVAAAQVSGLEVGGFFGALSAGASHVEFTSSGASCCDLVCMRMPLKQVASYFIAVAHPRYLTSSGLLVSHSRLQGVLTLTDPSFPSALLASS
jgi:sugar phosphate permease